MTIVYDPKRPLLVLLRWRGTVFQNVISDPLFWIFICFNIALTVLRYVGTLTIENRPEISDKFITLTGGVLVCTCGNMTPTYGVF